MSLPEDDLCKCRHAAKDHADGEGHCLTCAKMYQSMWQTMMVCKTFRWNYVAMDNEFSL